MNTRIIKEGMRDSLALGVGFIFLYLSIGMLGYSQSLTFTQTLLTTLIIFSTPLQFLLIQTSGNPFVLIPVILAMNARFVLMSAFLTPYFKETKLYKIMPSLILIVPSVFTGSVVRFKHNKKNAFHYFLSLGTPIYIISIICTIIGFLLSAKLTSPIFHNMMDIILPLQFTGLAAKHWPDIPYVGSYWAGFFLAPFTIYLFHEYNLLLAPFVIGITAVLIENKFKKGEKK